MAITQNGVLKKDENDNPVMGGTSSSDNVTIINSAFNPSTRRLLTDSASGSGTVTSVSVVTANGFAGTVATATTTPAITLSTTITGVLQGNGTAISAASTTGSGSVVLATSPTITGATLTTTTVNGVNLTTGGSTSSFLNANGVYSTPAGSGTVNAGTAGQLAYYATSTTAVSGNANITIASSALTIGVAGSAVGTLLFANATSGTITLTPPTGALGTAVLTLPDATDTLIGKATTDILTNKTYDTAGTGNVLKINGTQVSAVTGTGSVVLATSPTLVTPVLGVASATTINKVTITTPATGSTLTIADGKTLTVSNTLTFTGTDSSSVAFGAGGTVLYTTSTIPLTVGTTTITSGTSTRILYDNAGVLGEYTLTGSGTVVAMQTAPTFVTSITAPLVIGGSGTTGTQLTLKTTTGNGTTDALVIAGGNNGGTTFATFSANVLNLGTSATLTTGTIELGAATDTTLSRSSAGVLAVEGVVIPSISSTNTLTNKRITRRVVITTQSATPTINTDNTDVASITGLAQAVTSFTTNLSGTPVAGDFLEIQITDNGTARAITWGTSFVASTVALPTTTVISTLLHVLFEWDSTSSKWICVATA